MGRWTRALWLATVLGLFSVQGSGWQGGPLLVYQAVDGAGQPLAELVVADAQGAPRARIALPETAPRPIELIATAAPGRALARTA